MAEIRESLLDKVQDAIRSGTAGKEVKRSAKWFHDKVRGLKGELRNRLVEQTHQDFTEKQKQKLTPIYFIVEPVWGICTVTITTPNTEINFLTMIGFQ